VILGGVVAILALAAGILVAADRGDGETGRAAGPAACGESRESPVPQPSAALLAAAGLDKLPLASDADRVDRIAPPFSDSTKVTNPLFPISMLHAAILNGRVDGKPFKTETTLLPGTRILEWIDGQCVEVLVSQYTAYLDGRMEEVALDFYAQADDGSAWYLGEDVFNYDGGLLADLGGTWLAGKEGPAAMIMPAHPRVGDVYRPENIAGLVFEEVKVQETGKTVGGPRGPVSGAIVVRELHSDGTFEDKIFAPGYGEFFTGSGGDVEALALAVPTDALGRPVPAALKTLTGGADAIYDAADVGQRLERMTAAWQSYRSAAPPRLREPMDTALASLARADGRNDVRGAAIAVAQASRDLELQYRPVATIDRARFDLWLRQAIVDAQARDLDAVAGDVSTLEWIRDRIVAALDPVQVAEVDTHLTELLVNVQDEDLAAAAETSASLRAVLG
jgi:hypothetical protein